MWRRCMSMRLSGLLFVFLVVFVIFYVYFCGVILVWFVKSEPTTLTYLYNLFFHVLFALFLWSFTVSVMKDPGRVPLYWGFFLDDPEHKKRRYCLICHIFKPERCHHCSACNRCVLNMDHHCPWINNCVGFYNRKFFLLMLIYVIINTFLMGISMLFKGGYIVYSDIYNYQETSIRDWLFDVMILVAFGIDVTIFFVIFFFTKFHVNLVKTNTTTIENLDKKRSQSMFQTINYDMGLYYNWLQVFGKNKLLWPFPCYLESGKPVGDGVVWPQKYPEQEQSQITRQNNV